MGEEPAHLLRVAFELGLQSLGLVSMKCHFVIECGVRTSHVLGGVLSHKEPRPCHKSQLFGDEICLSPLPVWWASWLWLRVAS